MTRGKTETKLRNDLKLKIKDDNRIIDQLEQMINEQTEREYELIQHNKKIYEENLKEMEIIYENIINEDYIGYNKIFENKIINEKLSNKIVRKFAQKIDKNIREFNDIKNLQQKQKLTLYYKIQNKQKDNGTMLYAFSATRNYKYNKKIKKARLIVWKINKIISHNKEKMTWNGRSWLANKMIAEDANRIEYIVYNNYEIKEETEGKYISINNAEIGIQEEGKRYIMNWKEIKHPQTKELIDYHTVRKMYDMLEETTKREIEVRTEKWMEKTSYECTERFAKKIVRLNKDTNTPNKHQIIYGRTRTKGRKTILWAITWAYNANKWNIEDIEITKEQEDLWYYTFGDNLEKRPIIVYGIITRTNQAGIDKTNIHKIWTWRKQLEEKYTLRLSKLIDKETIKTNDMEVWRRLHTNDTKWIKDEEILYNAREAEVEFIQSIARVATWMECSIGKNVMLKIEEKWIKHMRLFDKDITLESDNLPIQWEFIKFDELYIIIGENYYKRNKEYENRYVYEYLKEGSSVSREII